MICYKDKTFCEYYKNCDAIDCDRALTEEVVQKAEAVGLPISMFIEKPVCFCDK